MEVPGNEEAAGLADGGFELKRSVAGGRRGIPQRLAARAGLEGERAHRGLLLHAGAAPVAHARVVSAYNASWGNPNLYDDFLRGSDAIAEAARTAGVRLIVVGGAGSLFIGGQQIVDSPEFPAEWKSGALAAREALNRLRADKTALDWTFVSPAMHLEPGERTGQFRLGGEEPVFDAKGENRITVADLAVAIVDELEKPQHRRGRFTAGY